MLLSAGTGGTGPLLEFDVDAAEEVFRTNVRPTCSITFGFSC
jgi:short-subunit dehydrogenase